MSKGHSVVGAGHDVSEYLGTFGLVKSYFLSFLEKKMRRKNILVFQIPQRIR